LSKRKILFTLEYCASKKYVKMALKLDFGSAIFLGKGKSGICAGKIISHSREDGLLCYTDFFPLRIGPLQLHYNVTYFMPK